MTIAEKIKIEMQRANTKTVWFGKPSIWAGCGTQNKDTHPANEWKKVLNALNKSKMFRKTGYILANSLLSGREIKHPVFEIIENE